MGFLWRLLFKQPPPPTISPFQKQARLWFVLRGQIYVSQAEKDAKFFKVCNETFTCKERVIRVNFWPPPTEKELYCQHCGCFVFHHRKCFTWITMKQRAAFIGHPIADNSLAITYGYLYLQGDRLRLEEDELVRLQLQSKNANLFLQRNVIQ